MKKKEIKQCKVDPAKPTFKHAQKIWELIDKGLTEGMGRPVPGEMCVEALVAFVMGEKHNDNPKCVHYKLADDKIHLNDTSGWPHNKARAAGLKDFAIAQLGSRGMSYKKYWRLFIEEIVLALHPIRFPSKELAIEYNEAFGLVYKELKAKLDKLVKNPKRWHSGRYFSIMNSITNKEMDDNNSFGDMVDVESAIEEMFDSKHDCLKLMCRCGVRALTKMNTPGSKWLKKLKGK